MTLLCIVAAVVLGFVLLVIGLAWLKARAARSDPDHARHD